jgi:hypothetical protein
MDLQQNINDLENSHVTFESITKAFLMFFKLLVHNGATIEILTSFQQTTTTHITDHIHEWH